MELIVVTRSSSFAKHLAAALPAGASFRLVDAAGDIGSFDLGQPRIVLLHAPSLSQGIVPMVRRVRSVSESTVIGVASDEPTLAELLGLVPLNIQAYFNSYMADVHYRHLLATLKDGQCWFAPALLKTILESLPKPARRALAPALDQLTAREREIAEAVAVGMNNKTISRRFGITERTVKAHLSKIFEKLKIPDRLALAVRLNGPGASP